MNDIVANILALYPKPDAQVSEEQADRLHHRDLDHCTEDDLRRELSFLRTWNFVLDSEWHLERERCVSEELRRRHDRANQARAQRRIVA